MVDDIKVETWCRRGSGSPDAANILKEGQAFEERMTTGKLREAVRILTNQSDNRPFQLDGIDAKNRETGNQRLEVQALCHMRSPLKR